MSKTSHKMYSRIIADLSYESCFVTIPYFVYSKLKRLFLFLSALPVRHWRVNTGGRACTRCLPRGDMIETYKILYIKPSSFFTLNITSSTRATLLRN